MWWIMELAKAHTVYQCLTLNNWMYTETIHPSKPRYLAGIIHLFPRFTQGFLMFDLESDLDYFYKLYEVNSPVMWLITDNVRIVTVVQVHEFCLNNSLVLYTVMTAYTDHITPINDATGSCGLWHTAIRTHMAINAKFFKIVMTLCFQMIKAAWSKTWECALIQRLY